MFKVSHVPKKLGQVENSHFLGVGADTEWLDCHLLSNTAVNLNFMLNGSTIRAGRLPRYSMTCL